MNDGATWLRFDVTLGREYGRPIQLGRHISQLDPRGRLVQRTATCQSGALRYDFGATMRLLVICLALLICACGSEPPKSITFTEPCTKQTVQGEDLGTIILDDLQCTGVNHNKRRYCLVPGAALPVGWECPKSPEPKRAEPTVQEAAPTAAAEEEEPALDPTLSEQKFLISIGAYTCQLKIFDAPKMSIHDPTFGFRLLQRQVHELLLAGGFPSAENGSYFLSKDELSPGFPRVEISDARPNAGLLGAGCMTDQADVSCSGLRGLGCHQSRCACAPTSKAELEAAIASLGISPDIDENKKSHPTSKFRRPMSRHSWASYSNSIQRRLLADVPSLRELSRGKWHNVGLTISPLTWWLQNEKRCMTDAQRRASAVAGKVTYALDWDIEHILVNAGGEKSP